MFGDFKCYVLICVCKAPFPSLSVEAGSDDRSWEEEGPCVWTECAAGLAGGSHPGGLPIVPRVLAPWDLVVPR